MYLFFKFAVCLQIVMLQSSLLMGGRSDGLDRYRDLRLDVDSMSYEVSQFFSFSHNHLCLKELYLDIIAILLIRCAANRNCLILVIELGM